jgi:hypothetical protein
VIVLGRFLDRRGECKRSLPSDWSPLDALAPGIVSPPASITSFRRMPYGCWQRYARRWWRVVWLILAGMCW